MLLVLRKLFRKRKFAAKCGLSERGIKRWKKEYENGGIQELISDNRNKCGQKAILSDKNLKQIKEKLENAKNGFRSNKEIQQWIKGEFNTKLK